MKKIHALTAFLLIVVNISFAQGYKVGDQAIDFKMKNVDGRVLSLSNFENAQGYILIFTCNHCPYSKAYEDRIIELDKKYKSMGYPVIAINPNDSIIAPEDSFSKMKIRASEKGFTFPYLLDADQSVARAYGATRTPHVFLLQKEAGQLIVRYIGAIDDNSENASETKYNYVADGVDALMDGENPDPEFTKAIGCSIKFAEK